MWRLFRSNTARPLDFISAARHFRAMIIAIDGTSASGKGTIAKRLAAWFGLPHMDTGRLYRAVGVAALKAGADLEDAPQLARIAQSLDLSDFDDEELRSAEAAQAASKVARVPEVRNALFQLQRAFATQAKGAVLDGRDIGTVIAPDADAKLWITASLEERARRRHAELVEEGKHLSVSEVEKDLAARDERDAARRDAPATKAADAVLIDTTDLTIDAAVDQARAAVDAVLATKQSASER